MLRLVNSNVTNAVFMASSFFTHGSYMSFFLYSLLGCLIWQCPALYEPVILVVFKTFCDSDDEAVTIILTCQFDK